MGKDCVRISEGICKEINDRLVKPMSLNFEEYYDIMVFFTKKRYIMFKGEDIKYKGVAKVRSNYCIYAKDCYEKLIRSIGRMEDVDDMKDILIRCFVKLLEGEVSVDELTLTKSVRPLEQYKTVTSPQYIMATRLLQDGQDWESRLEYVFVDNDERLQGYKMYTPYEVERNNMRVDFKYYLDRQVLPALKDLISVVDLEDYVREIRVQLEDIYY